MLHLKNGRGQLGSLLALQKMEIQRDVYLYHTWAVKDKSKTIQEKEYQKFKEFVDQHAEQEIAFISTKSRKDTWYTHFKEKSEKYLLTNCKKGFIIRRPTFIGKPCKLFSRDENIVPYGNVELITIEEAAAEIIRLCNVDKRKRISEVKGEEVTAKLVLDILNVFKSKSDGR